MKTRTRLIGTLVLGSLLGSSLDLSAQCESSGGSVVVVSGAGTGPSLGAGGAIGDIAASPGAARSAATSARRGRAGSAGSVRLPGATSTRAPIRGTSGRAAQRCAATTAQLTFVPTQENWARWWIRQGDEFIWGAELEAQRGAQTRDRSAATTSSRGRATGRGTTHSAPVESRHAPLRRGYVQTRVVTPLLALIEDEREDTLLREAAIRTLGSAVDRRFAGLVTDTLLPHLRDDDERIRSAAALTLGVAGDPAAAPTLRELAFCSQAGHALVGANEVSRRVRTAALLGLGFADSAESLEALSATIEALPDSEVEMKRAAIMALGLLEQSHADEARELLVELLQDRTLADLLKAEVPPALARLDAREAVPALHAALASNKTDRLVRQSCALALGRLAQWNDSEVVETLLEELIEGRDETTRNLAAIALARLGAADTQPEQRMEQHERFTRALAKQLWRPEHRRDGPFHALAAGLYLQAHPGLAPALRERLGEAFEEVSDPAIRGAYALALGMSGDAAAGEDLRHAFLDVKDTTFRAHCALGLGLLGDVASREALREAVDEKSLPAGLRWALGAGLMLLDDDLAPGELVAAFEAAKSLEHRAGMALALASHRDEAVVPTLVEALSDESLDDNSRVAACAALAGVTERDQLPWRSSLALDSNFATSTPTVDDVLGLP